MKYSYLSIIGFLLLFIPLKSSAQDISNATLFWVENGQSKEQLFAAGTSNNILRDVGTQMDIRICRDTAISGTSTYQIADINNGQVQTNDATGDCWFFSDVAGSLETQLWATVNTNEGRIEFLVSNNVPQPDLTVSELSYSPEVINQGQATTVSFQITNEGVGSAGSFDWAFSVDGTQRLSESIPSLAAGDSVVITRSIGLYPEGSYSGLAEVDVNGQVNEPNESNNSLSASFEIINEAPVVTITDGPAEGETVTRDSVQFTWTGSDDAGITAYEFDLIGPVSTSDILPVNPSDTGTPISYDFTGLTPGEYLLRVRATDNYGKVSFWETRTFFILLTPEAPQLISPMDGALDVQRSPTFRWSSAGDTTGVSYLLQIAQDTDFNQILYSMNTTNTDLSIQFQLQNSNTYYWRVFATNDAGTSDWSEVYSFTTEAPPSNPTLAIDKPLVNFDTLTVGESASETVTITNEGTGVLSGNISFNSNGAFILSIGNSAYNLSAGQSTSFDVIFSPPSAGSFDGGVIVTNNATNASDTVTIGLSGFANEKPDLVVGGLSYSPDEISQGEAANFSFRIINKGGSRAENFDWVFSVDNNQQTSESIPSLAAGDSLLITRQLDFYPEGSYLGEVEVDITEQVDELDETNNSQSLTFDIINEAPVVTITDGPSEGETVTIDSVQFIWTGSDDTGIPGYEIELQGPTSLSDTLITNVTDIGVPVSYDLSGLVSGDYAFRVRAYDEYLKYSVWEERNFTVDLPPEVPILVTPANSSNNVSITPEFDWNISGDTTGLTYVLQVSDSTAFDSIVFDTTTTESQATIRTPLDYASNYYWRVRAENPSGTSEWSGISSFITENAPEIPLFTINSSSLDFDSLQVGGTVSDTISITNSGSGTLSGSVTLTSGTEFSLSGASNSYSLLSGQSAEYEITFSPSTAGSFSGTVEISHNGSNTTSPIGVDLVGVANERADLVISELRYSPEIISPSDTVDLIFKLRNDGGTTAGSFDWSYSVDGTEVTSDNFPTLAAGDSIEITRKLGLYPEGSYVGELIVDVAGQVDESNESNNRLSIGFDVLNEAPVVTITGGPTEGETVNTENVQFSWSGTDDGVISEYEIELQGPVPASDTTTALSVGYTGLIAGDYTFRVRALDNNGKYSTWVERNFSVVLEADIPLLILPTNGATDQPLTPTLIWSLRGDTTGVIYSIQVADSTDFSTIVYETTTSDTQSTVTVSLEYAKEYYWRVRAENAAGAGDWSAINSFSTEVNIILGDVTNDGNVSPLDASKVLKHSVKITPEYPLIQRDSLAADVTCNGSISPLDASRILKFTVNLIQDLTCNNTGTENKLAGPGQVKTGTSGNAVTDSVLIGMGDYEVSVGSVIEPVVKLSGIKGREISAFHMRLEYDPAIIKVEQVIQKDYLGEGFTLAINKDTPGQILISGASSNGFTSDGNLIALSVSGEKTGFSVFRLADFELNEGNPPAKLRDGSVTVKPAALPDLSLNIDDMSVSTSDGENYEVNYKYELSNIGAATARDIEIKVFLSEDDILDSSDEMIEVGLVDSVNSGNTIEITQSSGIPSDLAPGNYSLIIYADSSNTIEEEDENNNIAVYSSVSVSIEDPTDLPNTFTLSQNYPNPFNPTTNIAFGLPQAESVDFRVFDMLGREVHSRLNQRYGAGSHIIEFNASALSSGIYFYRLQAGNQVLTRKMTLVK